MEITPPVCAHQVKLGIMPPSETIKWAQGSHPTIWVTGSHSRRKQDTSVSWTGDCMAHKDISSLSINTFISTLVTFQIKHSIFSENTDLITSHDSLGW